MVRKIVVILEFKYTECLQSYLLFIALYLLFGTEYWNFASLIFYLLSFCK